MSASEQDNTVEENSQGNVVVGLRLASSTSGEMISAAKSSTSSNLFGLPEDASCQDDDELVDIPLDRIKLESPEKVWQDVYQSPRRQERSKFAKHIGKKAARNDQLPTLDDGLSSSQCSDSEHSESTEIFSDDQDQLEHGEAETLQNVIVDKDAEHNFASKDSDLPPVPDLTESDIDSFMKKNQFFNMQPATVSDDMQESVWIKRNTVNVSDLNIDDLAFGRVASSERQELNDYEAEQEMGSRMMKTKSASQEFDTDEETDELLEKHYQKSAEAHVTFVKEPIVKEKSSSHARVREGTMHDADSDKVLIEGVLFRASYLGSTQMTSHGLPTKMTRMMQAQEAVNRVKAPDGENQPMSEVDLFISVEKIMVLNTNLQEILMDHCLRMISYIADIGDLLVVMARRDPQVCSSGDDDGAASQRRMQNKICCHVFESQDARLIAQSIGHAFQVAYMEFLKANGIEEPGDMRGMDYQDVLNQQEMNIKELCLFSSKETQREVIVPKLKGEALGVVIVESGWGSMLPTVVLANMNPTGPAARCNQLNVGFQLLSINGISLVGLPLTSCQSYIKAVRSQTVVKLSVVCCSPVIDVAIKRQDARFQLGFSVQNGVICSLLRGGIAERGGVRVGHKIIEINGESIVAVSHDKIVSLLANAVGEITMKTMLTSVYRLLIGQDVPTYI